MIRARIAGTAGVLPGRPVNTQEIRDRAFPDRTTAELERKTGIRTRYFCRPEDTVASVSALTLERALASAGLAPSELRRLILVSTWGFDEHTPATANRVLATLGIRHTADCMDLNNACSGFVTALDLACRCVATGSGPVAVVATELPSKYLSPTHRRPYAVFGDGSGAVVVTASEEGGILGSSLGNDGVLGARVTLKRQLADGPQELIDFAEPNPTIAEDVVRSMLDSIRLSLTRAERSVDDVRWFLLHQPNGVILRQCAEALGIDESRMMPIVAEVGSVSAASIPISLDRLARERGVGPDELVVFAAVGSGLSYGSIVMRPGALGR